MSLGRLRRTRLRRQWFKMLSSFEQHERYSDSFEAIRVIKASVGIVARRSWRTRRRARWRSTFFTDGALKDKNLRIALRGWPLDPGGDEFRVEGSVSLGHLL